MQFEELGINPRILAALAKAGYEKPSDIQAEAIPPVLDGKDLLGCSNTGSGKTAAFAVPILQRLFDKYGSCRHKVIRALILTPTRELALQIEENFKIYGENLPLTCGCVLGGVNQKSQEIMLKKGVDILIATPGRLNDLIGQNIADISKAEILVLDEADRMLDMGFIKDVKKIVSNIQVKRQTLLFSATVSDEIKELIDSMLEDYTEVRVNTQGDTVDTIVQELYFVDNCNKKQLLVQLLADTNKAAALVFTRTKHSADNLAKVLSRAGIQAEAIHSDKSQNKRQKALEDFKKGNIQALVATDIAARGIDIDDLPYVVNYNIPEDPEMYIHRIGRTGRAGRRGKAISFCCFDEKSLLKDVEKLLKTHITVVESPFPMEVLTPREVKKPQPRRREKKPEIREKSQTCDMKADIQDPDMPKSKKNTGGNDKKRSPYKGKTVGKPKARHYTDTKPKTLHKGLPQK